MLVETEYFVSVNHCLFKDEIDTSLECVHVYRCVHRCVSLEVYIFMCNMTIFLMAQCFILFLIISGNVVLQPCIFCCFYRFMCKIINLTVSLVLMSSKIQRKINLICCNYLGIFFTKYTSSQKRALGYCFF